jgi:hypothetical protein
MAKPCATSTTPLTTIATPTTNTLEIVVSVTLPSAMPPARESSTPKATVHPQFCLSVEKFSSSIGALDE